MFLPTPRLTLSWWHVRCREFLGGTEPSQRILSCAMRVTLQDLH